MKNKGIIYIVVIGAVIIGGFYLLNSYIYNEKQADFVVGEKVTKSGKVLAVDFEQIAFDGPYVLTLDSGGAVSTISVPSMGLPLCAAYKNKNIGDVSLIKVGDIIEVRGSTGEDGSIVPCDSPDDYLRPKPIVAENFEGEADPRRMTLDMKKWVWISAMYNDGRIVKPIVNKEFSLTFSKNGSFSATTDCNGIGGKYSAKGDQITFSEMVSTLMYCEGSQESEFSQLLQNTQSFHFTSKGELILNLKFDSGSVTFR